MTTAAPEASFRSEQRSPPSERSQPVACAFCRRRLGGEYFFTCRKCDASYCYIHMSRHQPALCSGREGRRRAKPSNLLQRQALAVGGGNQLLLADSKPADFSSANV